MHAIALLLPLAAAAAVDYCDEPVTKTVYSTTYLPFPVAEQETTEEPHVTASVPPVEEPTVTKNIETPITSTPIQTPTLQPPPNEPPVTPSPLPLPFSFEKTYLAAHNRFRELFKDTPPLSWNNDLQKIAQNIADNYKCNSHLEHTGSTFNDQALGENLAYGFDFERASAITAWFNEITDYDWSKPGFYHSTGHFTQLIWAESTEVGCGFKNCQNSNGYYIVCEYLPVGNWVYKDDTSNIPFIDNVKEPLNSNTKKGFNIDTLL